MSDWQIIYVHGIGNQPTKEVMKAQWDQALFGKSCDFSTVAYWADKRIPQPPGIKALDLLSEKSILDPVLNFVTKEFTQEFVHDVNSYLYNKITRAQILETVARVFESEQNTAGAITKSGRKPILVISHSLGTVVSYEVLRDETLPISPNRPNCLVDALITIGSPLGLDSLRGAMRTIRHEPVLQDLPIPWHNFYDPLDIVASDRHLKGEFNTGDQIIDMSVQNPDRHASEFGMHSITGYLSIPVIRETVQSITGSQP